MAPHITEILFKLGAGDQVVGRTDFCLYPAEAASIPSVGGYLNTDFEKIVRLQPDLIFQFPNSENKRKLESLGFVVEDVPNETVDEILNSILMIGKILGREQRGRQVVQGIRDTLFTIKNRSLKGGGEQSVLLVVGRDPGSLKNLYIAGKATYLSELIEYCGCRNAFAEIEMRYFSLNKESLMKRPIDWIFEFHPGWGEEDDRLEREKAVWSSLGHLQAVKTGRIHIFTERYFLVPGPRIARMALQLARIIHPGQFQ
ncbi:MAG: ABC transporter substrate-binding protein [Calditrichia bacterium]